MSLLTLGLTDPSTASEVLRGWIDVLALNGGYNTNVVLLGTALLGLAAGAVGSFTLLKKQALVADAFAHASLAGVAIAFLLHAKVQLAAANAAEVAPPPSRSMAVLILGAAVAGGLAVAAIEWLVRRTRLRADTATAAVSSASFGIGIACLSIARRTSGADQAGLDGLIFGAASSMTRNDAFAMGALAAAVVLAIALLFKPLRAVAFNARFAETSGLPIAAIDVGLGALVAAVTLAGMQAVGMLLVVALLVTPAATARLWTKSAGPMTLLSATLGCAAGLLGVSLSRVLPSIPTGAVVVLISASAFVASATFAPRRGVLAGLRRARGLRARVHEALGPREDAH